MIHKLTGLLTIMLLLVTTGTAQVVSAQPLRSTSVHHSSSGGSSSNMLGNDVSYPQCGKILPSGQAFGIVGVNDGVANTPNPCLANELGWAQLSTGITSQPKAQLYVNTANPGDIKDQVTDWPMSGTNSFGTCTGNNDQACSYEYGWERAVADSEFLTKAVPIANPAGYLWWLDTETGGSWDASSMNNQADLEGMTAYFESIGAKVGLYSTASQWSHIAGTVPASNLTGLLNWRPGGASLSTAKQACSAAPLTTDGTVSLTQYTTKGIDYDYSCK